LITDIIKFQNNIKIIFSGRQEPLREDVLKSMHEITEITKNNTGGIFNVCINYGSRAEIVDATKKIATLVDAVIGRMVELATIESQSGLDKQRKLLHRLVRGITMGEK
jgi:undecaprenyl diphosphate synthase